MFNFPPSMATFKTAGGKACVLLEKASVSPLLIPGELHGGHASLLHRVLVGTDHSHGRSDTCRCPTTTLLSIGGLATQEGITGLGNIVGTCAAGEDRLHSETGETGSQERKQVPKQGAEGP